MDSARSFGTVANVERFGAYKQVLAGLATPVGLAAFIDGAAIILAS
ncbi:MAG: hypothetical protein JXB47_02545 [Anaerolineae bacterium]|nr:hypothetical protein [Anaerolineae bacterium]